MVMNDFLLSARDLMFKAAILRESLHKRRLEMLSQKERLLAKLRGEKTDRSPVICTGCVMNAAISEIMNYTGHTLPEAHNDAVLMAALAGDIYEYTGFENLGVPFCMTVEAEVLGSEVNYGTLTCEPKITKELYGSAKLVVTRDVDKMLNSGRIPKIAEAVSILARRFPDTPIVGNLTGPITTAASLVNPLKLLKEFSKSSAECHRVLDYVTRLLIGFAKKMADNGVTVISVGDPTATGEILGPKIFREFALYYNSLIVKVLNNCGIPVIVHICGDINSVRSQLPEIGANAVSTDAMINLCQLKADFPELITMGNLSTYQLGIGSVASVVEQTAQLVRAGIDIISPACGLSTATSLELIRAMTDTVKSGN